MFGKYATKGIDMPRQALFRDLRATYMAQTGHNNTETAMFLEMSPQSCSTLASGSDKRQPPWYAVMRLVEFLGLELVLQADTIFIRKIIKEEQSEIKS
tara:strand:+ start:6290 stop:6583 length:294 start_codon:yes stop_codon:yes gene_type:complete